jgi:hypothetical protein
MHPEERIGQLDCVRPSDSAVAGTSNHLDELLNLVLHRGHRGRELVSRRELPNARQFHPNKQLHTGAVQMARQLKVNAIAIISALNHPVIVRSFIPGDTLKYNYVAHCSLDVFEERG